ncbi:MAG: vWA domain-containing protein [Chloroflexota bacterium]
MSLLTPLALLLSLLAIPIVAMYILKLRRRDLQVSSTLLWRKALDDVQANSPWQRLRPNILLVLQLLVLLALVFTVAAPAYSRSEQYSGNLVVVIDQSFGMQARDVSPSRFAQALVRAHQLVGTLGSGSVMSVIGMGAQPHLAIAQSSDAAALNAAIDSLRPVDSPPNVLAALSLASALGRGGQATRAVLLTSRLSGIGALPEPVSFPVQIVRIGGVLHDLGITAFSAVHSASATRALVRVQNFGAATARSDLNLWVDGKLADVRPLSVPAGKQQTLFWSTLPGSIRSLHAQLGTRDDLSIDKSAWAVAGSAAPRRILLISSGDYFLQTALELDPSVQLSTVRPSLFLPHMNRSYDMLIFDGVLPASLPAVSTLLIDPPQGKVGGLHFGVEQPAGAVSTAAASGGAVSSIMHFVDAGDVHVAQARGTTVPAWLYAVAGSGNTELIAAGQKRDSRYAVATFSLQDSDWPLRISFPVLVRNLVRYLDPGLVLNSISISVGQSVGLLPPPGTGAIAVRLPDGTSDTLHPPFSTFADTAEVGLYTVRQAGIRSAASTLAVNFFPSRATASTGPASQWVGQSRAGVLHRSAVPVSVAWALGVLALGLLSAEWWYSARR